MLFSMFSWFNSGLNLLCLTVLCVLTDLFQPCVTDMYSRGGKGRRLSSPNVALSANARWAHEFFGRFLPSRFSQHIIDFSIKANRYGVNHLTYSFWQKSLLLKIAAHCLYSFYYMLVAIRSILDWLFWLIDWMFWLIDWISFSHCFNLLFRIRTWRISYYDDKDAPPLRREWIGATLFVFGCILRLWAKHARGKFYDYIITVREGHNLTVRGPYKYLLHPDCSGTLIELLGFVIFTRSLYVSLYAVISCYVIFLRICDEERVLEREFGDEYSKRRKSISAVIPRVL